MAQDQVSASGDGAAGLRRLAPGALGIAAMLVLCVLEPQLWPVGLGGAALILVASLAVPRQSKIPVRTATRNDTGLPSLSALQFADVVIDPMILFDRQGILVHANAAAKRAFGDLSPGMMMQLRFRAPELLAQIERTILDATAPPPVEYLERLPIERLFRVHAAKVGADPVLNVLILRDQSEIRRVDRMRADFIANASHELRTPLASISGFIETLRGPARQDEKARDRFLGIMQEQTGRMARLIDDLLSLSRIEMKAMPPVGQETDLTALLAKVVEANALRASEEGVEIRIELPAEPMIVSGDRDELFQVFENLVENACKYGNAGGKVDVSLERTEDGGQPGFAASVRDYGAGIAPEHIPRITERFYRVETKTARKGTGLGLSIVKHIVTRHGARLSIRSTIGEGTTFTIFFPQSAVDMSELERIS